MSIDLKKLTPAPWRIKSNHCRRIYGNAGEPPVLMNDFDLVCEVDPVTINRGLKVSEFGTGKQFPPVEYLYDRADADAEFIALARNAFDILLRRNWSVIKEPGNVFSIQQVGWDGRFHGFANSFNDPYTAVVEAEKWFVETEPNFTARMATPPAT